ncbi:hypothetical protein [Streptomyces gibsoniae]|uniref:Integral membrane protein n=1 Tax=Streptomyces gibsoniae TaxID=3075529 RepID=A0ABU2TPJ6_9ACTN|nr:hypothetical protein [Streptomyces sp. DSM 41699]MDT0462850.1 hypothetical protein [Streptomyces sp. DSM 41699]
MAYGLLVMAMAAWVAVEPWGDPLDTAHALPTVGLSLLALPSVVPLVAFGVGAGVGRGTFLTLVVLLAWLEGAAVHWGFVRFRGRLARK